MYKDFQELDIWKKGYELLMKVYDLSETFSRTETFALTAQIRRSSNSIIANIAEAHGRFSFQDKIRVLYIARGECLETRSHIAVAYGRKYITEKDFHFINIEYIQLTKELNLYIKSLQKTKNLSSQ